MCICICVLVDLESIPESTPSLVPEVARCQKMLLLTAEACDASVFILLCRGYWMIIIDNMWYWVMMDQGESSCSILFSPRLGPGKIWQIHTTVYCIDIYIYSISFIYYIYIYMYYIIIFYMTCMAPYGTPMLNVCQRVPGGLLIEYWEHQYVAFDWSLFRHALFDSVKCYYMLRVLAATSQIAR